eukprot:SAG11_NODE_782_length_7192_cov_4.178063_5_plen_139_part_00
MACCSSPRQRRPNPVVIKPVPKPEVAAAIALGVAAVAEPAAPAAAPAASPAAAPVAAAAAPAAKPAGPSPVVYKTVSQIKHPNQVICAGRQVIPEHLQTARVEPADFVQDWCRVVAIKRQDGTTATTVSSSNGATESW